MNLKHVSFTRMEDGTKEDYEFLEELESDAAKGLADRMLKELQGTKDILGGYMIDRFEHSLQSATRAYRDGKSEEYVVMALLHDLGELDSHFKCNIHVFEESLGGRFVTEAFPGR